MFLYSKWCELNISTRHAIAAQFGIQKKGPTEVFDNHIKSDGYLIKEVEEALNIDALQKYIGTNETDMMVLWMWLIEKIEGRELTQVNMDTTRQEISRELNQISIDEVSKIAEFNSLNKPKRGRKPKQK